MLGLLARALGAPIRPLRDGRLDACYLRLECPFGADLPAVRAAYRRLVARTHPDLARGDPRRQQVATRLTARLTEAYQTLERALSEGR